MALGGSLWMGSVKLLYDSQLSGREYATRRSAEPGLSMAAEGLESENLLSLRDLLQTIRTRLWVILLTMIVLTGIAAALTFIQTPMYEGSIKILVGQERLNVEGPREDAMNLQRLTQTITEGISSRPVAESVIQ